MNLQGALNLKLGLSYIHVCVCTYIFI